jgi:carbamoyl-phosphate synthase small subunit
LLQSSVRMIKKTTIAQDDHLAAFSPKNRFTNRSQESDFFISDDLSPGALYLADGTIFPGMIPDWQREAYMGEAVFNTGMTGYTESLTDPSYAAQILIFTYPLIGNYGVDLTSGESSKIHVSGVVVSEAALNWSHDKSDRSLLEWLKSQNIPILIGADTRALTKHMRIKGTMPAAISASPVVAKNIHISSKIISIERPKIYNKTHQKKVILVDCGAKDNILRSLLKLPIQVMRVPYDYDYTTEAYDGVLLSNGPGDPNDYLATIAIARKALKIGKPIFGICLGTQIMGLAAGASTYKLRFGHRGHNQPCLQTGSERSYITSQNHGYAIDETSLPKGWFASFKNLNDQSVEGIQHRTKPFFSVQFHPEACPGPTDTEWLFERFYTSL